MTDFFWKTHRHPAQWRHQLSTTLANIARKAAANPPPPPDPVLRTRISANGVTLSAGDGTILTIWKADTAPAKGQHACRSVECDGTRLKGRSFCTACCRRFYTTPI